MSKLFEGHNSLAVLTLKGGPRAGYHGDKVPMPLADGRILVCLAQRGECRFKWGMDSDISWTLPQIEPRCSRKCPSRMQVASPNEEGAYNRYDHLDPYGFGWYKKPDDALKLDDPEVSGPVQPASIWVDPVKDDRGTKL